MALSVYYQFSAPDSFADADVVRVLEAARKRAISQHFGVVSALNRQLAGAALEFCIENPQQIGGVLRLAPASGYWFKIQLAHSTDSARIGLCRFAGTAKADGREVPSGLGAGWHFQSSCRTQNPAQEEFREFRKRHLGLIDLLRAIQKLGVETEVEDDGGFWENNDETLLEQRFKAEMKTAPLLDAAFADALEGHAPERKHALFGSPLRGQFFAQFTKQAK